MIDSQGALGLILTPKHGRRLALALDAPAWGADNGCFAQGDRFDLGRYLDWLAFMAPARGHCLFATAPDVVGDARATWARSAPVLPRLRALGYPAALVAQDDWDDRIVDWDAFDCLFVGGTTAFKLADATYELARRAKARGKWVHMGRVNSRRRLRAAAAAEYDSVDGTYLAFGPDVNLPRLVTWLDGLRRQPALPGLAAPMER